MVLLTLGVTLVSRNGIEPSVPGSSTVNSMLGSCKLMWCSSCVLYSALWITRVSSTKLTQRHGGCGAVLSAFTSNSSVNRLAIRGLMGEPMAAPWTCSSYLPWKRKYVFLRQNSISVTICGMDIWVLCGSVGSCMSLCLTMLIEWSTGTKVNEAFTSYEEMASPAPV